MFKVDEDAIFTREPLTKVTLTDANHELEITVSHPSRTIAISKAELIAAFANSVLDVKGLK